jgi:uncharacterized protein YjiS (DUF1127 family)
MTREAIAGTTIRPTGAALRSCRSLRCFWQRLVNAMFEDRSLQRLSAHQLRDIGVSETRPHRNFRDLL